MMKFLSPFFVILSCGVHIFCCGIPLLLSISSLGTLAGVSASAFEIPWFENIEDKFILVSGLILLLTIFAQNSANFSCNDTHCSTKNSDDFSKKLTFFAAGLYLINLIIFFIQR